MATTHSKLEEVRKIVAENCDVFNYREGKCEIGLACSCAEIVKLIFAIATPQWMPISTAPQGGTDILVTDNRVADGFPQVAYWHEGMWCVNDANIRYQDGFFTHWMPLPPPPQTDITFSDGDPAEEAWQHGYDQGQEDYAELMLWSGAWHE